ncbi:MAG: hypothetical protein IKM13_05945 [Clostridia bacterium]|nr:hypothetical protein [Clostridia bacterium]
MWNGCLGGSIACMLLTVILFLIARGETWKEKASIRPIYILLGGVALANFLVLLPVHWSVTGNMGSTFFLSAFNTIQAMGAGCEFGVIEPGLENCPKELLVGYQVWFAFLFTLAPALTFGFVLSFFKGFCASVRYCTVCFRKETYVFSELNDRSLALASDLRKNHPKAAIVFTDVFEENEESSFEMMEEARKLGAISFKKDILVAPVGFHAKAKPISFFAIGQNESENLNQAIKLIERYRNRSNTHLYVFSAKVESELLLTAVDKGQIKVRRVNEVQSLVSRILYEEGELLFRGARKTGDGEKKISAVVVGMGAHGTEMVKALAWFGQMDGYKLEIHAFDKDPLAEDRFKALAPELMSPKYNGVELPGEARYKITVHADVDVDTATFADAISKIADATYVFISLGSDQRNIKTAVALRMYFERMKIHPVIQAVVTHSEQKKALEGIRNFRGQPYDLTFIGDVETSYTEKVIIDSELEQEALERHLKWGKEEEFWTYEYNYRSSMASAIHLRARIACGIPGADKPEGEMTPKEKENIEILEHRRWNAYMRAEGYVFSGSKEKSSRNDLGKMHHDLVDYAALSEEEKRKDSRVGSVTEKVEGNSPEQEKQTDMDVSGGRREKQRN